MPEATPTPPLSPPSPQSLVEEVRGNLRAGSDVLDPRVEEAFLRVPRAAFLPDLPPEQVYSDDAIPVKSDTSGVVSSSSQPSMMAIMLRMLRLRPGQNVLEIGTATGYNAALMETIVGESGRVTTVEIDPQLAEQARTNLQRVGMASRVNVVAGDGAAGFAPRASYDRILSTVGVYDIPSAWVRQLKPGGIIVAPLWLEASQVCGEFHLQPDGSLYSERNTPCAFVRMRGAAAGNEMTARVGRGALTMHYTQPPLIDPAGLNALLDDGGEYNPLGGTLTPGEVLTGWLLYLSLFVPEQLTVAAFSVAPDQKPYGISGQGVAVIGRGTAAFAWPPGAAVAFGSADALLALQDSFAAWDKAGRPRMSNLRLRLTPLNNADTRPDSTGRLELARIRQQSRVRHWRRRDHLLDGWLD